MKKNKKLTLKKIEINRNDILSKNELKNIFGGYGDGDEGTGSSATFECIHEYSGGIRTTPCFMDVNSAISFCSFYVAAGYACRCYAC